MTGGERFLLYKEGTQLKYKLPLLAVTLDPYMRERENQTVNKQNKLLSKSCICTYFTMILEITHPTKKFKDILIKQ